MQKPQMPSAQARITIQTDAPALIVEEQAGPNMGKNANWNCWDFKLDRGSRAREIVVAAI